MNISIISLFSPAYVCHLLTVCSVVYWACLNRLYIPSMHSTQVNLIRVYLLTKKALYFIVHIMFGGYFFHVFACLLHIILHDDIISKRICFYFVIREILCLPFTNLNSTTLYACLMIPFHILTINSPLMTLNLRNTIRIYIQRNISWTKQILQTKKLLSLLRYKSYWQWYSYQRLRQTRWLRISYR